VNTQELQAVGKPCFYTMKVSDSHFDDLRYQIARVRPELDVRVIRGSKCRTIQGMFDETSAALQFPYYFGENWAAFDECMVDLGWLGGTGHIILIRDARLLLADEFGGQRQTLVRILAQANLEWASLDAQAQYGRPPAPFHVIMQCRQEDSDTCLGEISPADVGVVRFPLDIAESI
jgi:Barstar (barnase inhibitor)